METSLFYVFKLKFYYDQSFTIHGVQRLIKATVIPIDYEFGYLMLSANLISPHLFRAKACYKA